MRRLFASGRYRDISVRGVRQGDGVTLIFTGVPRYYVGRVTIDGVKNDRLASLLEFATKLSPGTAFNESQIAAGAEGIKEMLQQQGYYESVMSADSQVDVAGNQVNVTYTVAIGPQARVGQITLQGADAGLTLEEFRKKGKLKQGSRVTRDTTSNALDRLRKLYQKKDRLEATVSLQKQTYDKTRKQLDMQFHANQGPEVKVVVEGAKISDKRLHLLVPIFEEGTIDNDLLNEGVFNIRDYQQQQGYFDAKVDVKVIGEDTPAERVVFTVDRGVKHKVIAVDLKGNKYFTDDLLQERMRVQKADLYQRSGRYSPALVSGDVSAIQGAVSGEWIRSGDGDDGCEGYLDVAGWKAVEGGRDRGDLHDRGRAAAEVWHGGLERRGREPDEGCKGTDEYAAGAAVFAGDAFGRPGYGAAVLPEPRLRPGEGRYPAGEGDGGLG